MKGISKKSKKVLKIMRKWNAYEHIYDLTIIHDIEPYDDFRKMEYINEWFGFDVSDKMEATFIEFAQDASGGTYALWFYPNLIGKPPVVFFGSEGSTNILASSFKDFICLLVNGKILRREAAEGENIWDDNLYDFEYEDILESYKNLKNIDGVKNALAQDLTAFKTKISKKISCNNIETILSKLDQQPNFTAWVNNFIKKYEGVANAHKKQKHNEEYAYIGNNSEAIKSTKAKVKLNLPNHFSFSKEFEALCDWADENDLNDGMPFTGEFEFYDGDEYLKPWTFFDSVIDRFGILIRVGVSGDIALWKDDNGKDWLVYINFDFEECFILSDSFKDVLILIGVGYSDFGTVDDFSKTPYTIAKEYWEEDFDENDTESFTTSENFKQWIGNTFKINIPKTGKNLIYKGENHLKKWLKNQ